MYIAKNRAIQVPFKLHTREKRVDQKALLDSGATECFINPRAVQRLQLPTKKLLKPRSVRNVDGTLNKAGVIDKAVELHVTYNGTKTKHHFFVADIGIDEFLLGYPFLEAARPEINWQEACIDGSMTIDTTDAIKWRPTKKGRKYRKKIPAWIRALPDWEEGDEVWCRTIIGKSTVAQGLAIAAQDQTKRPWQEIVPPEYHRYKIWSEKEPERFPEKRPWDHAIDLKEDVPASINCRVYPLSPMEKEEQQKFLDTNLRLKRIRRSKSPYVSGFFFIKKKDGKYRPVQDYRNLNKWTIPNKYPLPLISDLIHSLSGKEWYTKFDIRWGYNNIRIKEGDEWKAAFKTSDGLFEPTVMFFVLTNSPGTFQTMVDDKFKEEVGKGDFN